RAIVAAVAAVVLLFAGYTAFRSYVDRQWYVGVSNEHVAIFQGIPAAPFGFELSHVDEDTGLDAAAVESLATYQDLREGINVDSRDEADSTVDQMRLDLKAASRKNA
ncbi:MAG: BofC C-terminal domain-containing protein, partial [Actinomycetota bacterium]|nr:BofC C-terminal domain-containing protein [Actinomycetota bacterium]